MELTHFDYMLPPELIAQYPAQPRDHSRLMIVQGEQIYHTRFDHILEQLRKDDVLVVNDTKVERARIQGRKSTGGKVELLLCQPLSETRH
ncbi:MAG: S-adenosylmethionine:tRNA ribosyltransferase-isomerase, partial [Nanoarchaeota archaeon]